MKRGIEARRDNVTIPAVSFGIAKGYPASEITIFRICPRQLVYGALAALVAWGAAGMRSCGLLTAAMGIESGESTALGHCSRASKNDGWMVAVMGQGKFAGGKGRRVRTRDNGYVEFWYPRHLFPHGAIPSSNGFKVAWTYDADVLHRHGSPACSKIFLGRVAVLDSGRTRPQRSVVCVPWFTIISRLPLCLA